MSPPRPGEPTGTASRPAPGRAPRSPPAAVAFQGEPGAFSEEAVHHHLGPDARTLPRRTFDEVRAAVVGGEAELGLLPVENSVAGTVVGAYDALSRGGVRVVGEVVRPIRHCLLVLSGTGQDDLRKILSHPVALAQCSRYLEGRPGVEAVAVHDTAGAARTVAEGDDPGVAAIAPRGAAKRYGLAILAEDLQDRPDNQTRFYWIRAGEERLDDAGPRAERGSGPAPGAPAGDPAALGEPGAEEGPGPRKSVALFRTPDRPGALVRVLEPFARHGVNLSKLESRPGGDPWTYRFFLEVDADLRRGAGRRALDEALGHVAELRVLGVFSRSAVPHLGGE